MSGSPCGHIYPLGTVDFASAWDLQKSLAQQRIEGKIANTLLLLEHPHVYTLGRRGKEEDILLSEAGLAERGVQVFWVDRGGEATYHGPGQLVGYPILDLRTWGGPVKYVRALEQVIIDTLADFDIQAGSVEGLTGVWIGKREKIASIGVKISRGVTTHGFALNVSPNLSYFDGIVPCGIRDMEVTSMKRCLGGKVEVKDVMEPLAKKFCLEFGLEMGWSTPGEELNSMLPKTAIGTVEDAARI